MLYSVLQLHIKQNNSKSYYYTFFLKTFEIVFQTALRFSSYESLIQSRDMHYPNASCFIIESIQIDIQNFILSPLHLRVFIDSLRSSNRKHSLQNRIILQRSIHSRTTVFTITSDRRFICCYWRRCSLHIAIYSPRKDLHSDNSL